MTTKPLCIAAPPRRHAWALVSGPARSPRAPANDNAPATLRDPLVRAALLRTARDNRASASEAAARAQDALRAGESAAGRHWLAVARLLASHTGSAEVEGRFAGPAAQPEGGRS